MTNGFNRITVHATDLAGNVTTTIELDTPTKARESQ
jgi:hypothetical protein